jgi:redox-sensitive bicupin YhaK (pirin superfamily)
MQVWDVALGAGAHATLPAPDGWGVLVVVLRGRVRIGGQTLGPSRVAVLARESSDFELVAEADSALLVLSGAPIDEPLVGYGPFVMNTREQIVQAIEDFNSGRFGAMS